MKTSTRFESVVAGIFFGLLIVAGMFVFAGTPGHISNYLAFVAGVFFFHLLLVQRFKNFWLGLLGSLLLVLIPSVFAQSFHFSTDVAFMTTFIITTYLAALFAERKRIWLAVLVALGSAFLIDMKFAGLLFPVLLVDTFFLSGDRKEDKKVLWLYLVFVAFFLVIAFPLLGHNVFANFTSLILSVSSTSLPWLYALRWFVTTVPPAFLILAVIGVWYFVDSVPHVVREELFMGGWLAIPLILGTLVRSHLFDIWGQMFFLYPAVLYFVVLALAKCSPRLRASLLVLLAVNVFFILLFMSESLLNLTPSI